jgi:hypothetical protein
MVCRGDCRARVHEFGSTPHYEIPQRVVGYRPTYTLFPSAIGCSPLTGVLYQKAYKSGAPANRLSPRHVGGTGFEGAAIAPTTSRYRDHFAPRRGEADKFARAPRFRCQGAKNTTFTGKSVAAIAAKMNEPRQRRDDCGDCHGMIRRVQPAMPADLAGDG